MKILGKLLILLGI